VDGGTVDVGDTVVVVGAAGGFRGGNTRAGTDVGVVVGGATVVVVVVVVVEVVEVVDVVDLVEVVVAARAGCACETTVAAAASDSGAGGFGMRVPPSGPP